MTDHTYVANLRDTTLGVGGRWGESSWSSAIRGQHKRGRLLLIAVRLPVRLPLLLPGFLHCFPLFLVCLVQHLLLLLDRLLGLPRIFLGTDALGLSR